MMIIAALFLDTHGSQIGHSWLRTSGIFIGTKFDSLNEIFELSVPVFLSNRKIATSEWLVECKLYAHNENKYGSLTWVYNNKGEIASWEVFGDFFKVSSWALRERFNRRKWGFDDYLKLALDETIRDFGIQMMIEGEARDLSPERGKAQFLISSNQLMLHYFTLPWDTIFDALNIPVGDRPQEDEDRGLFLKDKFGVEGRYHVHENAFEIINHQEGYRITSIFSKAWRDANKDSRVYTDHIHVRYINE